MLAILQHKFLIERKTKDVNRVHTPTLYPYLQAKEPLNLPASKEGLFYNKQRCKSRFRKWKAE